MGTGRWPIPIFVGELGVDNAAARLDRMLWLSWVRMASEGFGFSWAHWNMYESSNSSKGMGPWTDAEKWNPDLRRFDADPLEALIGRYHFSQPATAASVTRTSCRPSASTLVEMLALSDATLVGTTGSTRPSLYT